MKRSSILSLALFGAMLNAPAAHAIRETHGGGGLLCQAQTRVELLDLREAVEFGLKLPPSEESVDAQIEAALRRLDQMSGEVGAQVRENLRKLQASVEAPEEGRQLAPPRDALIRNVPEGCFFVGIAQYDAETGKLVIDPKWYERLDRTGKAALWIHEAVYKFYRDVLEATDSRGARALTGALFSTVSLPRLLPLKQVKNFYADELSMEFYETDTARRRCQKAAQAAQKEVASNPRLPLDLRLAEKAGLFGFEYQFWVREKRCVFKLSSRLAEYAFKSSEYRARTRDADACRQEIARRKSVPSFLFSTQEGHWLSRGGLEGPSECYMTSVHWKTDRR